MPTIEAMKVTKRRAMSSGEVMLEEGFASLFFRSRLAAGRPFFLYRFILVT